MKHAENGGGSTVDCLGESVARKHEIGHGLHFQVIEKQTDDNVLHEQRIMPYILLVCVAKVQSVHCRRGGSDPGAELQVGVGQHRQKEHTKRIERVEARPRRVARLTYTPKRGYAGVQCWICSKNFVEDF